MKSFCGRGQRQCHVLRAFRTQNQQKCPQLWPLFHARPSRSLFHSLLFHFWLLAHIPPTVWTTSAQHLYLWDHDCSGVSFRKAFQYLPCRIHLSPCSWRRLFAPVRQHLSHPAFYLCRRDSNKVCIDRNHVLFIAHSPENTVSPTNSCHFERCTRVFKHHSPPWYRWGLQTRE